MKVRNLRFDITGPLEPQNYFCCSELTVVRETERADLVHIDMRIEYRNTLSITMDALRHRGAVRGNSSLASVYRWLTTPIRGDSELFVALQGKGEGATRLRLTMQTEEGVAAPH